MQKFITKSSEETRNFAEELSKNFKNGGIIALSGELGSGKTTFAQGFARGLAIKDKITSPTFLIIRQHPIPGQKNFFFHIDLYRLENINLNVSGLKEILADSTNIILIEWADKIAKSLPKNKTEIKLRRIDEDLHEIIF